MTVRFYQVECGDAASIRYTGCDGNTHFIFVDAGYERTYREVLSAEITAIADAGNVVDLWVISHIHDDHIGGVISYMKAIATGERQDIVSAWWYNSLYAISRVTSPVSFQISETKSFAQGEKLTEYLVQCGRLPAFEIVNEMPAANVAGLHLTVLSPSHEGLNAYRKKYSAHVTRPINYHELTEISEPAARITNDYNKLIESFDLATFTEDASIENASSIALITELGGRRILWLADSLPHVIVAALKKLGYSQTAPLHVDLVKVSHHGSRGNNSDELYSLIRCTRYVFCANGNNKHQLPTKECLVRILKNPSRPLGSSYEFLFPHNNIFLRSIFQIDGEDAYQRYNFKMIFQNTQKWLEVAL